MEQAESYQEAYLSLKSKHRKENQDSYYEFKQAVDRRQAELRIQHAQELKELKMKWGK